MVDVIREEPLGPGEKGRVAQALCRKAEELEASRLEWLTCSRTGWFRPCHEPPKVLQGRGSSSSSSRAEAAYRFRCLVLRAPVTSCTTACPALHFPDVDTLLKRANIASPPQAAVVVVASQRKSGISEFLLGSVAAHCAQHSSRPVLVVHAPQPGGSGVAGPGLMGRLASAAAAALGGHPEDAEQQQAAAAAAAEQQRQQLMQQPACSVGRHVILAVDDSGQ